MKEVPDNVLVDRAEVDGLRSELARLRGVVEAVRALPAQFRAMADDRTRRGERVTNDEALAEALAFAGNCYRLAASEVERVLASVPSSGETGERAVASGGNVMPMRDPYRAPASPEPTGAGEVERESLQDVADDFVTDWGEALTRDDLAGVHDWLLRYRLAARPVPSREALAQAWWVQESVDGGSDRAWAEAAWDDMGGSEPTDERAKYEIRAAAVLAAVLDTQEADRA